MNELKEPQETKPSSLRVPKIPTNPAGLGLGALLERSPQLWWCSGSPGPPQAEPRLA